MRNKNTSNSICPDEDGDLIDQFQNQDHQITQQKQINEDSILDTFIQWMTKSDKTKKDEQIKAKDKQHKGKKKRNFLKRGRPDTNSQGSNEELRTLSERLSRLESSQLLQNVHLSRPSTPKVVPSTSNPETTEEPVYDKYRVMYLLVRVEQQLEHMRKVIQKMQENGAKRSRIRSVSKVYRQMETQHKQLLRILANDATTLAQIGDADDMELFFMNIDSICSATQEISFDGDDNEALCNSLLSNNNTQEVIIKKDGKVKLKKAENCSGDLRKVFGDEDSDNEEPVSEQSRRRNTKEYLEQYRRKGNSKSDVYNNTGNGDRNKLLYKSEAIDKWSDTDTDTDEEMSFMAQCEGQKYKWPLLNTGDERRLEKEKKLHNLMTEIDDLMLDVGLADSKSEKTGITYEVLMMGSGEMTKAEKKEALKKKYKQFDTNPDRFKGAKSKNPSTLRETKAVKKSKSQSDPFVEEFDKLLNECDNKK